MKTLPLNLNDLSPREATFDLSTFPNKKFTLCRWSLRIRAWASEKYTNKGLQEIFAQQRIVEIADMAFFMLKEKDQFADQDAFLDAIVTVQDQINLIKALLETVGIGEPEIEKINASLPKEGPPSPNVKSPSPPKAKTGAKSSTP